MVGGGRKENFSISLIGKSSVQVPLALEEPSEGIWSYPACVKGPILVTSTERGARDHSSVAPLRITDLSRNEVHFRFL